MRQAYVCGPYTHMFEVGLLDNIASALATARYLTGRGWYPIVPHVMGPHRATWDEAMERCRSLVRGLDPQADVVVVLANWEQSKGAQEEVALARALGIRVMTIKEAVEAV